MVHPLRCSAAVWELPGPGIEPTSPALAGGLLTAEPPGNPVQFSAVAQSWPTLCDPVGSRTRGFPGCFSQHRLPELAQTHVHRVGDAIQPADFYSLSEWKEHKAAAQVSMQVF